MHRNPLIARLHAQARALCTECCSVAQTSTASRLSASRRLSTQSNLTTSCQGRSAGTRPWVHPRLFSHRQHGQSWRTLSTTTTAASVDPATATPAATLSLESDEDDMEEDLDDLDILASGRLPPAPPAIQQLRDKYIATKESHDPRDKQALLDMYHTVARDADLLAQLYPVDFLQAMYAAKALHSLPGMRRVIEDVGKTTYRTHPSFYHVMLKAYMSRNDYVQGEYIWRLMKRRKVKLTQVSYHIMLRHCKNRRNIGMALGLLKQMETNGIPISEYTYVLLLGVCFRKGKHDLAQQLFDEMPRRGLQWTPYHFSTLLVTYTKAKDRIGALRILDEMQDYGFVPNTPIYNSLLSVTADVPTRHKMYKEFLEQGFQPNIQTMIAMRTSLDGILRRMEEEDKAAEEEKEMEESGDSTSSGKKKSRMNVTREDFNILLTLALKASKTGLMKDVLQAMKRHQFQPDAFTFSTLMDAFVKVGEYQQARDIFEGVMASDTVVPDVVVYTNAISAALGQSDTMGAMEILKRMLDDGLMPNAITMNMLLTAMVRGQYSSTLPPKPGQAPGQQEAEAQPTTMTSADSIEMAELIINLMRQNGIREDVRSCNILISAYARANEPEKMMRTFRRMTHELQIPPESLTYEMLILGHLRGGNLRYAIDMYFAMRERDLYGHSVVHNQLLSALVASGQAQQTLQLWRDLSRSDRVLDDQSFGIMLDACDRFGLLEERHQIEQDRLRWKARTTRVVVEKEEGREEEDVIGLAQRYRHHRKQHQPSSSQSGGASNPWSA